MLRPLRKYRQFDLVILIDQAALVGGALKSILAYYKFKNSENQKVLLLDRAVRNRYLKFLFVLILSRKILVNSLSSFNSWLIIFVLLVRRDAVIYFHESDTAIIAFKKRNKLKYFFLKKILSTNRIACISNYQKLYLERHFESKTELIFNYSPSIKIIPRKVGRKVVLMAGYLMERKGVSFYSKIADFAINELKLPWDFYWAGSKASKDKMYLSPNVTWLGEVELIDALYPQIDAFFLSSEDEPFGLVCVEALKYYKHVVTYKQAGASELLQNVSGCKIYHNYEIIDAVQALEKAFSEVVDKAQVDYIIKDLMSLDAFVERVDLLFVKKGR